MLQSIDKDLNNVTRNNYTAFRRYNKIQYKCNTGVRDCRMTILRRSRWAPVL